MTLSLLLALGIVGILGGIASGVLGFGGGVLLFPLLFYLPPLFGAGKLDAQTIAAIVVVQVFFAALVGGAAHWRSGRVKPRLAIEAGLVSALTAFIGSIASTRVSEQFLLTLFGIVTMAITGMLFLPGPTAEQERLPTSQVHVPKLPLAVFSSVAGLIVGFLGAGNFVFVPLLIYIFKVPTRVAIASSLVIALLNTAAGFLGKLITGQVPLLAAALVVAGASLGAVAGEWSHRRLSPALLRYIYASMVVVITIRVWITLLGLG
ncbi:MAG TPA: sulfite exporter TauE/SafE family protein [Candidatus Eisenbacteria bacterium]|nr:sulfite exporter TauE/SafE family protein [Candidatus Eisenbacteria bacterium]